MFRAILETQWKWTRGVALFATLAAFAIPLAAFGGGRASWGSPLAVVGTMQSAGMGYAVVAAGLGLAVAVAAWSNDHRGRHVYALSLPVPRWHYSLMRLGAGAVFLAPPVIGLFLGAQIVAFSGAVPAGLHAYPVLLTLRFAFAAAVAYAIFFAISSSTPRTAGVLLATIAVFGLVQYVVSLSGSHADLLSPAMNWVFGKAGALSVFSGRWMLIDA